MRRFYATIWSNVLVGYSGLCGGSSGQVDDKEGVAVEDVMLDPVRKKSPDDPLVCTGIGIADRTIGGEAGKIGQENSLGQTSVRLPGRYRAWLLGQRGAIAAPIICELPGNCARLIFR